LATGDVASRDADGFLWITGRKAEFIKMRGIRVGYAEIEAQFSVVPGVIECAAAAVPHVEAGEAITLYVVTSQDIADVFASIRRCVPPAWVCDSVCIVAELPRNPHGKLVRSRLPEVVQSRVSFDAPGAFDIRRNASPRREPAS